jgi:hypothetical protein
MEFSNASEQVEKKYTLIIYLDLLKTSYRYFIEFPNVTAGELVERILYRYVEQGYVKEKEKDFSLYLVNSKYIESKLKVTKNKQIQI